MARRSVPGGASAAPCRTLFFVTRPHLRSLRALACLLILGFATTIAIAWGLSVWHRTIDQYTWQFKDLGRVQQWSAAGAQFYTAGSAADLRVDLSQSNDLSKLTASWLKPAIPPIERHANDWLWVFDARGWPMLAMSCAYSYDGVSSRAHNAILTPLPPRARGDLGAIPWPVGLPVRPIWPGFLFNSLFWGAAWLALLTIPLSICRSLRRRRGQCPKCAYDLRATPAGNPCPECGQIFKNAATTAVRPL